MVNLKSNILTKLILNKNFLQIYKQFIINVVIFISTLSLLGCNPLAKNEKENFKDMALKNLNYSHMDSMSGDIFKFNLETKE